MTHDDPDSTLRRWSAQKRRVDVPEAFEASVMARVRAQAPTRRSAPHAWIEKPLAKVALWAAACLLLVVRLGAVLGVFLVGCAGRP